MVLIGKLFDDLYLFGSYLKLTYSDKSDIDIAIILDKFDKNTFNKSVSKLETSYNQKIEIHYFNKNLFYKNKKYPLVKDILRYGVKLFL